MDNQTAKIKWACSMARIEGIIENEGVTFKTENEKDWTIGFFLEHVAKEIRRVAMAKIPHGEVMVTLEESSLLEVNVFNKDERDSYEEEDLWWTVADNALFYDAEAREFLEAKEVCDFIKPRVPCKDFEYIKVDF